SGLENPAVLDAIAHDVTTDEVMLAMYELRPWTDPDLQLFQLQEKLNAYVSFALDGEMAEAYPSYVGKKMRIQLRTRHEPHDKVLEFASLVREQLAFQNMIFEVILMEDEGCDAPGGCGCSH
ncbi:MAG: DUF6572 domain-containing protein, partial [Chthoniobacterales bacterium]